MITFRTRVTRWIAGVAFALVLLLTLGMGVNVYVNLKRAQRHELKALIQRIDEHLNGQPPTPKHMADLDEKINFIYSGERPDMAYAFYDADGKCLYQYDTASRGLFQAVDPHEQRRGWILFSTYKDWTFFRRETRNGGTLIVASSYCYDLIDHTLIALAIAMPLMFVASLLAGRFLSNKFATPLARIGETAIQIDSGNLAARIPQCASDVELRQLVVILNTTFERLQQSMSRVEQFSADAAHQLKTPLTAIRGNLDVCLRNPRTAAEYQETIVSVLEEIAALRNMVDSLLLLARPIDDKELAAQFSVLDLTIGIRRAVELLEGIGADRGIKICFEPDTSLVVKGIETFLPQLWHNLIHNALMASPDEGSVQITAEQKGSSIIVRIIDHGLGIPESDRKQIFERFRQLKGGRPGGTGLGLAVAKWIVELHHGEIAVEGSDSGTIVCVRLPAAS